MSQYVIEVELGEAPSGMPLDEVRAAAGAALAGVGVEGSAELTILLTDDRALQRLNRVHMGRDEPTDVLSFPMDVDMPGAVRYLGDVAISVEAAERQAQGIGHSLRAELQTLTVHAVLHLLGYNHETAKQRDEMWAVQASILTALAPDIVIPALEPAG